MAGVTGYGNGDRLAELRRQNIRTLAGAITKDEWPSLEKFTPKNAGVHSNVYEVILALS